MYSTSSSSESSDTKSFATIELESRDEVNPVAKEESRGDEEVGSLRGVRDDQGGISMRRSDWLYSPSILATLIIFETASGRDQDRRN